MFQDKKYLLRLYKALHPEDGNVTEDDIKDVTIKHKSELVINLNLFVMTALTIYSGSARDKINGKFERIVGDMVLLCNYPDEYRKETRKNFEWLNENASLYDFESVDSLLTEITDSLEITSEIKELFNIKHAHIVVATFKRFVELENDVKDFGKFLEWFVNVGNETEIDGRTWNEWNDQDIHRSTRDSGVVLGKLNYLVTLMDQYYEGLRRAA